MKPLHAKNKYQDFETMLRPIDEIVPASVYKEIPDEETLRADLEQGILNFPLLCFETDQKYWQTNHLRLYHAGSPTLPEVAPEIDGRVYVVWSGRQRYQLAKQMGYTHIDCIHHDDFFEVTKQSGNFKKM